MQALTLGNDSNGLLHTLMLMRGHSVQNLMPDLVQKPITTQIHEMYGH